MSTIFVLDPGNTRRLLYLIEALGAVDVLHEPSRVLSHLEEVAAGKPLILVKRLSPTAAGDLFERVRWIRPGGSICHITDNPEHRHFLPSDDVEILNEPMSEGSIERLDRILTSALSAPVEEPESRREAEALRIGRYFALEEIGSGGEGLIYRGWDPLLRRQVAIKICAKTSLANIRRTLWDGRNAGSVAHPNVIKILDCLHTDDCHALIMEYAAGGDLASRLERGRRLDRGDVYRLGSDIAQALAAVHGTGLVHGDLKPSNILINDQDRYLLSDFGASHAGYADPDGWYRGTPAFLPPETFFDQGYCQAGDVYGLGVLLFRALTGKLPFYGASLIELMEASISQDVPSCRWVDSNPRTARLLGSMMAKQPEKRPGLDDIVANLHRCGEELAHAPLSAPAKREKNSGEGAMDDLVLRLSSRGIVPVC